MIRQKTGHEIPSTGCQGCTFLTKTFACTVPGGTCIKRAIAGFPGHYVGDILVNTGVIKRKTLKGAIHDY